MLDVRSRRRVGRFGVLSQTRQSVGQRQDQSANFPLPNSIVGVHCSDVRQSSETSRSLPRCRWPHKTGFPSGKGGETGSSLIVLGVWEEWDVLRGHGGASQASQLTRTMKRLPVSLVRGRNGEQFNCLGCLGGMGCFARAWWSLPGFAAYRTMKRLPVSLPPSGRCRTIFESVQWSCSCPRPVARGTVGFRDLLEPRDVLGGELALFESREQRLQLLVVHREDLRLRLRSRHDSADGSPQEVSGARSARS